MGTYYTYQMFLHAETKSGKLRTLDEDAAEAICYYLRHRPGDFEPFDVPALGEEDHWIGSIGEGGSWDDDNTIMEALSKEFPNVVFEIEWHDEGGGSSDPSDTHSVTYWKNGKRHHAAAIFKYEPYNPKKLKRPKKSQAA